MRFYSTNLKETDKLTKTRFQLKLIIWRHIELMVFYTFFPNYKYNTLEKKSLVITIMITF